MCVVNFIFLLFYCLKSLAAETLKPTSPNPWVSFEPRLRTTMVVLSIWDEFFCSM